MKVSPAFYAFIIFFVQSLNAPADAAAGLQNDKLPAKGRQETLLSIPGFGRYSLISQSEQGVALGYIDKMSGPSEISGSAGTRDGRIDSFLDSGEYKVITYADDEGSGEVSLGVTAFSEVNETATQLVEHKLVSVQLGDFQQRSYWFQVMKRKTVIIEAAGRSLGDLRLWRDGNWLLDTGPQSEIIEPEIGKPLNAKRLAADLNPGLYQLVAYGGETLPWSETSDDQPFHLRMGIPVLAANGIDRKVTSPFGYDRWLVPATTDYYRLELKEKDRAHIEVSSFDRNYRFLSSGRRASISKESRIPVAEVRTSKGRKSDHEIVTIAATAGQPYTFQRFGVVRQRQIRDPGTYWISTLHSGYGEDSADATSILTDYYRREKYVDSRAIPLNPSNGWQRRFNILDTLTLFFEVEQPGNYRVEAEGIEGQFLFEPFTTFRGNNYKTPKARRLDNSWELDPGFYVLTITPDRDARGVATLSVYAEGKKPVNASPAHIASRYQSVQVKSSHRYNVYLNQQPGVVSGILVRKYPIDLSESMPLTLNPGEKLSLSVKIPASGELIAQNEDGSLASIRLKRANSNAYTKPTQDGNRYPVESGRYQIDIQNPGDQALNYQLQFTDADQLRSTPLPDFDLGLVPRPNFLELKARQPRFLDLKKQQWAAFNVIVDEPGLYRLESSGLLETQGIIRTRVNTRLDHQAANGSGRNFLIQQYLREGEYQLALSPRGETEGHLGVALSNTALIDGGNLRNGVAARYSLPSAQGLVYHFEIEQAGRYQLQSFGSNGYFSARLEDGDGWPLLKPGISSNFDLEFHAGQYRLVVLPTALPARVLTHLQRIEKPVEREGHGPFAMDLNQNRYTHTWLEPQSGKARHPDVWTFTLPAAAETSINLSEGMAADLIHVDGKAQAIAFNPLRPLKRTLPAGQYRIETRAERRNNRLDYRIDFNVSELLVGHRRMVTAPVDIDISIGRDSLIELSSFGRDDVKASLYDANDRLLGSSDDRDNDWNFNLIQSLSAGPYRLRVSPVGKATAQTLISLSEPEAADAQALALPAEFELKSPLIHRYNLDLSEQSGVFAVAAESRDAVSLTLEKRDKNNLWHSIADTDGSSALLLVSIDNDKDSAADYRLSVWSPEQRGAEIRLAAAMLNQQVLSESSLSQGIEQPGQALLSHRIVATTVQLDSAGMFTLSFAQKGLAWAGDKDQPLQEHEGYLTGADKIWLVSRNASQGIQAKRVFLDEQEIQFNVDVNTPAWVDSQSKRGTYQLVVAESRTGLPGVAALDGDNFDARQIGVGFNSTMTLVLPQPDSLPLKIWNSAETDNRLAVRLKSHAFKQPDKGKLTTGQHDASLAGRAAVAFDLIGKLQDIDFSLPKGIAAVLFKKDRILHSFWADTKDQNHQVWSDADHLILFNTGVQDRVLNIKLNPVSTSAELSPERIFKHYFAKAGIFTLTLDSPDVPAGVAEVYGDNTELLIQDEDGVISRGRLVSASGNSLIHVSHGVGLVTVWLNSNEEFSSNSPGDTTSLPAQIDLTASRQTIDFERDKAGFITLQSPGALIARWQRNGLADRVAVYENGVNTSVFLPQGKSRLHLQSTGSGKMNSMLHIGELNPVELEEGLGDRVSLLPGDARVYRFTLPDPGDIGLGVQATLDLAEAYLFNHRGELLGRGVTQKHSLSPGIYYLKIELPAEVHSAVDIKPAIVGLENPSTGPSKEIMLDYQQYSRPEAL